MLENSLRSAHFTALQTCFRFAEVVVRFALFVALATTVDLASAILFAAVLLDVFAQRTLLETLLAAVLLLFRLGAAILLTSEQAAALAAWGVKSLFKEDDPSNVFSLGDRSVLVPFVLFAMTSFLFVCHRYLSTTEKYFSFSPRVTRRSVYQAVLPRSSKAQLTVVVLGGIQRRSTSRS